MKLRPGQRRLRLALKRFIYSQLLMRDGFLMMLGRTKPLVSSSNASLPPA